ncbi:MAG TPA: PhoH family protein [Kineosporiaceae bacterium]
MGVERPVPCRSRDDAVTAPVTDRDLEGGRLRAAMADISDSSGRPVDGGPAERGRAGISPPGHAVHRIVVPDQLPMISLLGARDEVLRAVERAFPRADVHVRGNEITVSGPHGEVVLVERLIDELVAVVGTGQLLTVDAVEHSVAMLRQQTTERPADVLTLNILSSRGRTIRPKTLNQKRYVDAIDDHTIVFGIGPAGTGKTYLAMAKAVQALQGKRVNRIILTRPAVEAGERLGFLPGTLTEKIDPYLRPLYDALHDMIDPESIPRLMAAGTIEVAPLAYMRGRAQPVDTPVLTPTGFRPIGELQVGELVVGSDGLPTPVLGVYPQGRKQVFRVRAQDGAATLACAEHLWFVRTPGDRRRRRPGRVLRTQDLAGRVRRHRFELPLTAPVEFVPREVPIDPYVLGLLLSGAGAATSAATRAISADPGAVRALAAASARIGLRRSTGADGVPRDGDGSRGGPATATPGAVALAERALAERALAERGLAGAGPAPTGIPERYLLNTAAVRLAVLQGLLDRCGGAGRRPGRWRRVRYRTCSERMRDDVIFLVRSLGGVAGCRARHGVHVVDIRLPVGVAPFRRDGTSPAHGVGRGGRPRRFIESIEPAGEADCVCISVAAADSLYLTDDFLVTHNTLNDAFIILDEAQNTSPEQMKMFLTRLGFNSKMVVTGDITQVDLPTGTLSGLRIVRGILEGLDDVHFAILASTDVVRHRLVSDIVDAYTRWDEAQQATTAPAGRRPADRSRQRGGRR